jgi:hypothetical protein
MEAIFGGSLIDGETSNIAAIIGFVCIAIGATYVIFSLREADQLANRPLTKKEQKKAERKATKKNR